MDTDTEILLDLLDYEPIGCDGEDFQFGFCDGLCSDCERRPYCEVCE